MKILRRLRELRRRNSAKLHRNFGIRCAFGMCNALRMKQKKVAKNRWLRLFNKNIALCKHVSGRIECDACPVPEG